MMQEVLTPSDPFWNSLLSYNIQPPATKYVLQKKSFCVETYFPQSGLEGI